MNTKNLVVVGMIVAVVLLAGSQAFAAPSYYGWGSLNQGTMSMMGRMNGHMSNSACNMMNGQEMMENMMNGQSMDYQQCQQYMGPGHNMTEQQCQAMHEQSHT